LTTVPLPPDYHEGQTPSPRRRRNWTRIVAWTVAGLAGLILLLAIAIVGLLHNEAFRQYLLRIAHSKLSEAV